MFHQPVGYGVMSAAMPHHHSMYYQELERNAAAADHHQQLEEKEAYKLAALRQAVLSPANMNKALIYEVRYTAKIQINSNYFNQFLHKTFM